MISILPLTPLVPLVSHPDISLQPLSNVTTTYPDAPALTFITCRSHLYPLDPTILETPLSESFDQI